ncbi:MAG: winged helix-turn-helix domain-containing protein [Synechocystis sp.]|nr:winged helix-turn-helix domain-containing protein [Synechocystis sp.]
MTRLLTSSKTRPCPVCAKTNGNCRTFSDSDLVLCMTLREDLHHPDYRYVRESKDNTWSTYVPHTDDGFDRDAWERSKTERQQRDREIERQRREKCLSPDRRDQEIRSILVQLSLTDGDRRYLENRNVPAATISRCRSVKQWHKLASPVHVNLPGVSKYGDRLNNPTDGILVAIPDHAGRLVAIRLHNPKAKEKKNGKKYSWLSSASRGVTPHLPNGENPIALFWPNGLPTISKPNRIGLCEGMEFKAPAAANRLGFPVIGFSGYQFSQSPKLFWEAIAAVNPDAEIVLIPDGGAVANVPIANTHRQTLANLESANQPASVTWWGQFTKADGDIDEIPGDRPIEFISAEQFLSYCPERSKTNVEKFKDWVKQQTRRIKPKGFGAVNIEGDKFTGSRADAWQQAIERGQTILDNTLMGSGKSHSVPHITNPYGGKIWYLYSDHRNPTVEEIAQEFVDLFPRNSHGYYTDAQGKIRPATDPTIEPTIKPNCIRAELFPLLTELGHDPNDGGGSNPICQSCPKARTCSHADGWYRADRRRILNNVQKIRAHISSLPRDWDYTNDIIICDEPSQLLAPTETLATSWNDLLQEADRVRSHLTPELWAELDQFLQSLKPLFGKTPRYGLTHDDITAQLPPVSEDLVEAIAANPLNLADLFPKIEEETIKDNLTPEERQKWGNAIKALNAQNRREAVKQSQENLANTPPNVLTHLVSGKGVLRLTGKTLTITLDRRSDYAFLNKTAANIFLDATLNGDRLRTLTGLEGEIQVINNTPNRPLTNQTVNQIKVQGIGSKSLSNTAINRLAALCRALGGMPTIALKAWAKYLDIDGYWWRNSRGTNDYAGEEKLLALGLPNPNVGAIEDQYLCLQGNLDGFEEHYARLVNEEILQLVGRQRANRYPDRQFVLNLVTPEHTDLSWLTEYGITLIVKTGFEITPAAGTENQFTRYQIVQAIIDGCRTQTAISEVLGMTQQAISKALKAAGATIEKLVASLSKLMPEIPTTGPYKPPTRASCITPELLSCLDWFFGLDISAICQDAIQVICRDGWDGFVTYLENYPKAAQAKYYASLWPMLTTYLRPWPK